MINLELDLILGLVENLKVQDFNYFAIHLSFHLNCTLKSLFADLHKIIRHFNVTRFGCRGDKLLTWGLFLIWLRIQLFIFHFFFLFVFLFGGRFVREFLVRGRTTTATVFSTIVSFVKVRMTLLAFVVWSRVLVFGNWKIRVNSLHERHWTVTRHCRVLRRNHVGIKLGIHCHLLLSYLFIILFLLI